MSSRVLGANRESKQGEEIQFSNQSITSTHYGKNTTTFLVIHAFYTGTPWTGLVLDW